MLRGNIKARGGVGVSHRERQGVAALSASRKNVQKGPAKSFVGVLAEIGALRLRKLNLELEWLKNQIAKDIGALIPAE